MPTLDGLSYTDYWEGYNESFSRTSCTVSRVCQVAWERRHEFIRKMVGYSIFLNAIDQNANSGIHRYTPHRFPGATGHPGLSTQLYAVRADLETVIGVPDQAGVEGLIDYQASGGLARYRVTYEPLTYAVQSDAACTSELNRYVTKTWQPTVESLTIPGNLFEWAADDVPITTPIAKLLDGAEIQYSWWDVPASIIDGQVRVPTVLMSNISGGVGKVNDGAFDANYTSLFAAKTLLALPPRIEAGCNAIGEPNYNIHYKFIYKPNGWNKFYRPGVNPPAFGAIRAVSDSSTEPYTTYTFDKFFQTL